MIAHCFVRKYDSCSDFMNKSFISGYSLQEPQKYYDAIYYFISQLNTGKLFEIYESRYKRFNLQLQSHFMMRMTFCFVLGVKGKKHPLFGYKLYCLAQHAFVLKQNFSTLLIRLVSN